MMEEMFKTENFRMFFTSKYVVIENLKIKFWPLPYNGILNLGRKIR
jgi:hypothetical protein